MVGKSKFLYFNVFQGKMSITTRGFLRGALAISALLSSNVGLADERSFEVVPNRNYSVDFLASGLSQIGPVAVTLDDQVYFLRSHVDGDSRQTDVYEYSEGKIKKRFPGGRVNKKHTEHTAIAVNSLDDIFLWQTHSGGASIKVYNTKTSEVKLYKEFPAEKRQFKLAVNPVDNQLYMLSSEQICKFNYAKAEIESVHDLDRDSRSFCFGENGEMYFAIPSIIGKEVDLVTLSPGKKGRHITLKTPYDYPYDGVHSIKGAQFHPVTKWVLLNTKFYWNNSFGLMDGLMPKIFEVDPIDGDVDYPAELNGKPPHKYAPFEIKGLGANKRGDIYFSVGDFSGKEGWLVKLNSKYRVKE